MDKVKDVFVKITTTVKTKWSSLDKKIKIVEVPISYAPRTVKEGKKIGFKDGLRAIICILKYH